ncbi:MAG: putative DNA-binding protein [Verrucomicrobiaceae bacterium]|nr:putative DNA-binding protein [Verrucomicrobiaceae bacterium]
MTQLSDQFGSIVRRSRESNGWSQEVLADRAGLNRSYLGEIERGSAVPSLTTISKIATALEVSVSSLIALCEQPSFLNNVQLANE